MEKQTDFKIIELPTHQVLLTRDFDDDEENTPLLVITVFLDGVKVNQKLGYPTDDKRDEMFNTITDKQLQRTLDGILEMFNQ